MVDMLSSCKDVQSVMGQGQNVDAIMKIYIVHGPPLLLYSEN